MATKIGIIGDGNVGSALARRDAGEALAGYAPGMSPQIGFKLLHGSGKNE